MSTNEEAVSVLNNFCSGIICTVMVWWSLGSFGVFQWNARLSSNRTMARLKMAVVVLDHLNNRKVNCPPYTVVTISRNRLYLSPGIDGIRLAPMILLFSIGTERVPNYTI